MLFSELPDHSRLFCDSNILTYAFLGSGPLNPTCFALFERCARREIELYTSPIQASNTIHRIMIREAIAQLGIEPRKATSHLKKYPNSVKALQWYKEIPRKLTLARVQMLDVTYREIHSSKRFRDDYGLMTDDSIILALMHRHNLKNLASNDDDFKRIPDIQLWTPD